jgi:hypothetical protein
VSQKDLVPDEFFDPQPEIQMEVQMTDMTTKKEKMIIRIVLI